MWEMPPIFNNHPNNPNQGPNQHQQQNQPPHFHNTMNDPLGINSQNGPPGPGPSPGHGHSHGHQHNPHSGHASGRPGDHPGPGADQGMILRTWLFNVLKMSITLPSTVSKLNIHPLTTKALLK